MSKLDKFSDKELLDELNARKEWNRLEVKIDFYLKGFVIDAVIERSSLESDMTKGEMMNIIDSGHLLKTRFK